MNMLFSTRMVRRPYHATSLVNLSHAHATAANLTDALRSAPLQPTVTPRVPPGKPSLTLNNTSFGLELESVVAKTARRQTHTDIGDILHSKHASWECIRDGSLDNINDPITKCLKCEFVSPKLSMRNGQHAVTSELQSVCSILHELGADVNTTCGFHVHIDAESLQIQDVIRIAINYAFFEQIIDGFMDKSRRNDNNKFIYSIAEPVRENFTALVDILQSVRQGCGDYSRRTLSVLNMINPHRKLHKLNFTNAFYYSLSQTGLAQQNTGVEYINTIENRHHDATMDAHDILSWVRFNLAFIEHSKNKTFFNLSGAQPAVGVKLQMLADFIDDDELMNHYVKRMNVKKD